MDCKITSTKKPRRAGLVLSEMVVGIGVGTLLVLTVTMISVFSTRSFYTMFNYVDLDDANRMAIDQLTRDVRQANRVTDATTNSLTLEDADGLPLTYSYSPNTRTLTRTKGNGAPRVILRECDQMSFTLGQRNTMQSSYEVFPAATPATCKVINVAWICSRTIFGKKENTESVQTARIVIRKQGS